MTALSPARRAAAGLPLPRGRNYQAPITKVDTADGGVWDVTTETGTTYRVDAPGRTVTRTPPASAPHDPTMRRDDEPVRFLADFPIIVGASMVMWLDPLGPGAFTERTTSPVTTVTRVNP